LYRDIICTIAFEHLILSPGHAVWSLRGDPRADRSWYLREYQQGEPGFYLRHIRYAVELAAADERALLIFSGSQTFAAAGPRSEAQGYWMLAEQFDWWGRTAARARAITEEFALDSFQNVLFSLCRFHEFTGGWPAKITVAGWGFKAQRFVDLHRAAVRFPVERFHYAAVNDPEDVDRAARAEAANRAAFASDPYGCQSLLAGKRLERDPFRRRHGYRESCPELRALFDHRGPKLFSGALPWDTL
jgi:hypothetical protein